MTAAPKLATYSDLMALDEGARGEIIAGQLEILPAPLPRHSKVQGALRRFIGGPFDDDDGNGGPGGWWILIEIDVRFGHHDIVRPDLCGWKRERLVDAWDTRPIDIVPDWICEVTSPSTGRNDRVAKARLYRESKVPYYWLVDPETRVLEALILEGEHWLEAGRFSDGDVARIPPFDAVELDIGRLFPPASGTPSR